MRLSAEGRVRIHEARGRLLSAAPPHLFKGNDEWWHHLLARGSLSISVHRLSLSLGWHRLGEGGRRYGSGLLTRAWARGAALSKALTKDAAASLQPPTAWGSDPAQWLPAALVVAATSASSGCEMGVTGRLAPPGGLSLAPFVGQGSLLATAGSSLAAAAMQLLLFEGKGSFPGHRDCL